MDRDLLITGWKLVVARGVVGVAFGILAIFWPVTTGPRSAAVGQGPR